ncbi:MAG: hypothetical protein ACRDFS_00885, partial [Chloroflexota bacterium]
AERHGGQSTKALGDDDLTGARDEIAVTRIVPTPLGRLYPTYVDEWMVLLVESKVPQDWAWTVDIDADMTFDIDSEGTLGRFDVLGARQLWEVSDPARDTGPAPT